MLFFFQSASVLSYLPCQTATVPETGQCLVHLSVPTAWLPKFQATGRQAVSAFPGPLLKVQIPPPLGWGLRFTGEQVSLHNQVQEASVIGWEGGLEGARRPLGLQLCGQLCPLGQQQVGRKRPPRTLFEKCSHSLDPQQDPILGPNRNNPPGD